MRIKSREIEMRNADVRSRVRYVVLTALGGILLSTACDPATVEKAKREAAIKAMEAKYAATQVAHDAN